MQLLRRLARPSLEDCHWKRLLAHTKHSTRRTWTIVQTRRGWHGMCRLEAGAHHLAVDPLDVLEQRGSAVDKSMLYDLLKRCISQKDLVLGTRVHALAVKNGYASNALLANQIICMYASHERLEEAMEVFTKVPTPNRHMWTSIILGHARYGKPTKAVRLYREMRQSNLKAHDRIFVAALKAAAAAKDLTFGREVHADILQTSQRPNKFVGTCLVDMYSKCGSLENARRVFDSLTDRDVVTWTAMIAGYAESGHGQEALSLYASMQQEGITLANYVTFVSLLQACASARSLHQGKHLHSQIQEKRLESNLVVGTCLVDMYIKCGSLEDARKVFDTLPSKNLVTWNAMISGYAQHGHGEEALTLYRSMQLNGISDADEATYVALFQACGTIAGLEKGKEIHDEMCKRGLVATNMFLASTLIDMYGKCGSMVDAHLVFDAMPTKDSVTWTALIAGYARLGESEVVFDLFQRMRENDLEPDSITFLGILTACSHAGLVEKGRKYFEAMKRDYQIAPSIEHFSCMVDLLGRAGQVDKAMEVVKTMPFQPNAELWRTVLGACQKWGNVELGRAAFECAMRLDKTDAAAYVLMSNIFAAAHMPEEGKALHAMRVKEQAWKEPGHSWWTDSRGMVHTFVVGDKGHPEIQHIHAVLIDLLSKMKKEGYVPHLDSTP